VGLALRLTKAASRGQKNNHAPAVGRAVSFTPSRPVGPGALHLVARTWLRMMLGASSCNSTKLSAWRRDRPNHRGRTGRRHHRNPDPAPLYRLDQAAEIAVAGKQDR